MATFGTRSHAATGATRRRASDDRPAARRAPRCSDRVQRCDSPDGPARRQQCRPGSADRSVRRSSRIAQPLEPIQTHRRGTWRCHRTTYHRPMAHHRPVRRRTANRLAGETSPYLLQHAHNPVDWFPWGPEALARAPALDRPIFLSIGYAACHWCHVMERESFEDETTAAVAQRAVRGDQGRPRGAPGPRPAVHGRGPGDDGPGRLADVGVPRRPTAGRSSAARTSRTRRATGCRRSARCSRASARAWTDAASRARRGGRPARRGARPAAGRRRRRRRAAAGPAALVAAATRRSGPSSTRSTAAGAGRPSSPSR